MIQLVFIILLSLGLARAEIGPAGETMQWRVGDSVRTFTGVTAAERVRPGDIVRLGNSAAHVLAVTIEDRQAPLRALVAELGPPLLDANAFAILPLATMSAMFAPGAPLVVGACAFLLANATFAVALVRDNRRDLTSTRRVTVRIGPRTTGPRLVR